MFKYRRKKNARTSLNKPCVSVKYFDTTGQCGYVMVNYGFEVYRLVYTICVFTTTTSLPLLLHNCQTQTKIRGSLAPLYAF